MSDFKKLIAFAIYHLRVLPAACCGIQSIIYNLLHTNAHKRNIILNRNLYSGQTVSIFRYSSDFVVFLLKWLFMGTEQKLLAVIDLVCAHWTI